MSQARIQAIIDLLLQHPHAGQRTSKGHLRRVVVHPYPYLTLPLPKPAEPEPKRV